MLVDFGPFVTTVENSALEPSLKDFILRCFQNSKTGTMLDKRKLVANINYAEMKDRPVLEAYLRCLFKSK